MSNFTNKHSSFLYAFSAVFAGAIFIFYPTMEDRRSDGLDTFLVVAVIFCIASSVYTWNNPEANDDDDDFLR